MLLCSLLLLSLLLPELSELYHRIYMDDLMWQNSVCVYDDDKANVLRMCLLTVCPCLALATYGNWPHRSCPGSRFVHCNALRHSRTGRCDSGTGSPGTSSYSPPHRIHPGNRDSRCTEHFRSRSLRCGSGTDHWRSLYGINQREFY